MNINRDSGIDGYGVDYRGIYEDNKNLKPYYFNIENVKNVKNYHKPKVYDIDNKKEVTLKTSDSMASRIWYASFLMIICLGLFTAFVDSLDIDGINILVSKISSGFSTIVMERQSFEKSDL